ncbi:MAG TPA: UbiA family prenyltransferase [Saprospiraceae bacterium]|nr:UbiA family prenyltransferase [Saprospiraceae bacterium]
MANGVSLIRKLSNLILYSSLWIGACAAALVTFTYDVTGSGIGTDAYVGFIFCGTLVLYAIHRLTGLEHIKVYHDQGRFEVIRKYRSFIIIYGVIGLLGTLYFLLHLPMNIMWWLVLPGMISFMYVVPLGKRKRWRDYSFIKIFLISTAWAALTGLIPFVHTGAADWKSGTLLFFERALFIFAIAIPFDIRDLRVDDTSGLKTLPQLIGVRRAKVLALIILGISALLAFALISMQVYDHRLVIPYLICCVITALLIWNSQMNLDDHYYSGLLDGTMFLMAFGYWVWT